MKSTQSIVALSIFAASLCASSISYAQDSKPQTEVSASAAATSTAPALSALKNHRYPSRYR